MHNTGIPAIHGGENVRKSLRLLARARLLSLSTEHPPCWGRRGETNRGAMTSAAEGNDDPARGLVVLWSVSASSQA